MFGVENYYQMEKPKLC